MLQFSLSLLVDFQNEQLGKIKLIVQLKILVVQVFSSYFMIIRFSIPCNAYCNT